ncbi:type VII secretion target [Nocardia sp. CNY236]|uniref:type VII secretion target n=1 Tax=Nocardia sp. CNY236 TaxID=1169152 RepID=UPI0003F59950|nr:type VII secretion target [Nocardia sp. CNY236]
MTENDQRSPAPTTLEVDPAALQAFARTLREEAAAIGDLNTGNAAAGTELVAAAAALPGTDFAPVAQHAADAVDRSLHRIGARLTTIADNLRNAAGAYELAEDDFAARLRGVGLLQ